MNIVRTIVWVLLLAVLLIFAIANWDQEVEVQIWDNLVWDTKLPAVVVVSFLIGLVPMWLLHRASKWHLHRRIGSLESSARAAALAHEPAAEPLPHQTPGSRSGPASTDIRVEPPLDRDRSGTNLEPPHPEPNPAPGARVDEFGPRDR